WTDTHQYSLKSKVSDKAGNLTQSSLNTFYYDETPPLSFMDVPVENQYYKKGDSDVEVFSGSSTDQGSGVELVEIRVLDKDNGLYLRDSDQGWEASSDNWLPTGGAVDNWTYTINYPTDTWSDGGEYLMVSRAKDYAGNAQESYNIGQSSNTFYYDTTIPTVEVSTPSADVNTSPVIQGTANDIFPGGVTQVKVRIWRQDGTYYTGVDSNWDTNTGNWLNVTSGLDSWEYDKISIFTDQILYKVMAKVQDIAGNWSNMSSSATFIVDMSSPTSTITTPVNNKYYNSLTSLGGAVNDDYGDAFSGVDPSNVEIQIKDEDTGNYWNGSVDKWTGSSTTWRAANYGGGNWTYSDISDNHWDWVGEGHKFTVKVKAGDNAGNIEVPVAGTVFYFDDTVSTSAVTYPVDTESYSGVTSISGVATDVASGIHPAGVDYVKIRIKNPTGDCLDISQDPDSFVAGDVWNTASDTTTWTLAVDPTAWTTDTVYTINSRVYDKVTEPSGANVEVEFGTFTFTFDNAAPTTVIEAPTDGDYRSDIEDISGTATDLTTGVDYTEVKILSKNGTYSGRTWDVGSSSWTVSESWNTSPGGFPSAGGIDASWTWSAGSTTPWTSGNRYEIFAKGYDRTSYSSNAESEGAVGTIFTFDNVAPISVTTYPAVGVGYSYMDSMHGTASDLTSGLDYAGIAANDVYVAVQKDPYNEKGLGDSTKWWDWTLNNGFTQSDPVYKAATYDNVNREWDVATDTISWASGVNYLVKSYAEDKAAPKNTETDMTEIKFSMDTQAPVSAYTKPLDGASYNQDTQPTQLDGTATDDASGVDKVEVAIYWLEDNSYYDGASWGSVGAEWFTASGSTTWSYAAIPGWQSGQTYRVYSKATDKTQVPEANVETEHYVQFTVDINPPEAEVTSPPDGEFQNNVSSVDGTATDDFSGVEGLELLIYDTVDDKSWVGTWSSVKAFINISTSALPEFSYTGISDSDWTSGHTYKLVPRGTDYAGNITINYSTATYYYDNDAPVSLPDNITDGSYYNTKTSIEGTCEDNPVEAGLVNAGLDKVELKLVDVTADPDECWTGIEWSTETLDFNYDEVQGTGSWDYSFNDNNWTSGHKYRLNTRGYDNIGNMETEVSTTVFYIDINDPNTSITEPIGSPEDSYNNITQVTGNADLNPDAESEAAPLTLVEVQITDDTDSKYWTGTEWSTNTYWVDATNTSNWYYAIAYQTVTWINGHNFTLKSRATDEAGNTESTFATLSFSFDDEAPESLVTSPYDGEYVKPPLSVVEGDISDNKSGVDTVKVMIKRNTDDKYYVAGDQDFTGNTFDWDLTNNIEDTTPGLNFWSFSVATDCWTDGVSYTVQTRAEDAATDKDGLNPNIEVPVSSITFTYDNTTPQSDVVEISTMGHVQFTNIIPRIKGTANDSAPGKINNIKYSFRRVADSKYFNGADWTSGTEQWLDATSTMTAWSVWSATATGWFSELKYNVKSKAYDNAGNIEPDFDIEMSTFIYDAAKPDSLPDTPIKNSFNKTVNSISGTADDNVAGGGSGVAQVRILIEDETAGKYWNGVLEWQTGEPSSWPDATGLDSWDYSDPKIIDGDFTDGHRY
ncbi:MAG: hypothetical protein PF545_07870, partial [Elusimicrobia bacterium]|nr:hypothetical protein [Elusimicrobiota bacterium]